LIWLFAIVVVVVLGGVAIVAAGRGEPMARAYDDRPDALVPAGRPLTGADLRRVRFSVALRGYRMSEVDTLLARLAAQLEGGSRRTASAPTTDGGPEVVDPPTA
jgi:DivIVA domain-containing protein